ncbi:transcription repressor OFP1-like [Actinidia eriantha]|uniref:transcription repressor OFP1-like n=1 Tax=Actinidia eriantha TaxID=165200 RepID=UPI00258C31EF|nr:transcription repressor OFP1-like [Actinidia eriantha]
MGNNRFRISEMIPNAWFYKLKDMSKTRNQNTNHPKKKKHPPTSSSSSSSLSSSTQSSSSSLLSSSSSSSTTNTSTSIPPQNNPEPILSHQRKSYYFSRDLSITPPNTKSPTNPSISPKKSPKQGITTTGTKNRASSVSSVDYPNSNSSPSLDYSVETKFHGFNSIPELGLPPIVTKQPEFKKRNARVTEQRTSPVLRGVRIKTNSPRIARQKSGAAQGRKIRRRILSESFAVVKTSADPQRDFKESMVEMILENNIKGSKDLEDLLACYLQLNSDEYHGIIIKVFKQIWFDLAGVNLK